MEEWKDIEGYEGLYQISNEGRVKALERYVDNFWGTKQYIRERVLKGNQTNGYLTVSLCKNGIPKNVYIHRLVAEAFIPNPDGKPCIDHKDTNTFNNNVTNLCWCTAKENSNNPKTRLHNSLGQKKNKNNIARLNEYSERKKRQIFQLTLDGKLIMAFDSAADAAKELNYNESMINRCCNGGHYCNGKWYSNKTYKGFLWQFTKDTNIGGQKTVSQ